MKQDTQNNIKHVNIDIDFMQLFVTINKDGMMTNADASVKN